MALFQDVPTSTSIVLGLTGLPMTVSKPGTGIAVTEDGSPRTVTNAVMDATGFFLTLTIGTPLTPGSEIEVTIPPYDEAFRSQPGGFFAPTVLTFDNP